MIGAARIAPGHHGAILNETPTQKTGLLPDVDHVDAQVRPETLRSRDEPVILQLPLVPCYAQTIHKTQALSIKHIVRGCVEGVVAFGQVYVLVSLPGRLFSNGHIMLRRHVGPLVAKLSGAQASPGRCTDPRNFELVGVQPKDLVEELAAALRRAGLEPDDVFSKCVIVSGECLHDPVKPPHRRFYQRYVREGSGPMKHRTLDETLNPQLVASRVLMRLLSCIDRVDVASQDGSPRPAFLGDDGLPIFPADGDPDERWWLTELSKRKEDERLARDLEECLGSSEEDLSSDAGGEVVADKKPGDETCGEGSDDMEDTFVTSSSSRSGALLPLQRSQYSPRRSYEDMPSPPQPSS